MRAVAILLAELDQALTWPDAVEWLSDPAREDLIGSVRTAAHELRTLIAAQGDRTRLAARLGLSVSSLGRVAARLDEADAHAGDPS